MFTHPENTPASLGSAIPKDEEAKAFAFATMALDGAKKLDGIEICGLFDGLFTIRLIASQFCRRNGSGLAVPVAQSATLACPAETVLPLPFWNSALSGAVPFEL
ncbi:MAG: hypothetical protein Q8O64_20745 [Sideroxyarcus sp.]|nr:hypothetical protein [Sideroxyarcus sp.]